MFKEKNVSTKEDLRKRNNDIYTVIFSGQNRKSLKVALIGNVGLSVTVQDKQRITDTGVTLINTLLSSYRL
jgi:hypothetical protein